MGASTPFEGMSHEAMLAWLDRANGGTVQQAADRLAAAAQEIRTIADDLKVRPQWVEWKGAGADAFRTWSADLANAALRLGDFSEGSAKWLTQAASAIATAQAAMPRATPPPNPARAPREHPQEPTPLESDRERLRQEAVTQMRKLSQAYRHCETQLNALERPRFPSMPTAIVPEHVRLRDRNGTDIGSVPAGQDAGPLARSAPAHAHASASFAPAQSYRPDVVASDPSVRANAWRRVHMDADSVASMPASARTTGHAANLSGPTTDGGAPAVSAYQPALPDGLSAPSIRVVPERNTAWEQTPSGPRQSPPGRNAVRMPGSSSGITGGRSIPTPQTHGPVAQGRGVGGGSQQHAVRATGPRPVPSVAGEERAGVYGGRPVAGSPVGAAPGGGRPPRDSQNGRSQRDAGGSVRGNLVEDDETWLRADPRVVPPVID